MQHSDITQRRSCDQLWTGLPPNPNQWGKGATSQLRVTSYEIRDTSYELQVTSYELQVTSYELRVTSYELRVTSYEFKLRVTGYIQQPPLCYTKGNPAQLLYNVLNRPS